MAAAFHLGAEGILGLGPVGAVVVAEERGHLVRADARDESHQGHGLRAARFGMAKVEAAARQCAKVAVARAIHEHLSRKCFAAGLGFGDDVGQPALAVLEHRTHAGVQLHLNFRLRTKLFQGELSSPPHRRRWTARRVASACVPPPWPGAPAFRASGRACSGGRESSSACPPSRCHPGSHAVPAKAHGPLFVRLPLRPQRPPARLRRQSHPLRRRSESGGRVPIPFRPSPEWTPQRQAGAQWRSRRGSPRPVSESHVVSFSCTITPDWGRSSSGDRPG